MSLLTKFQTLINLWFPDKNQDTTNFNNWLNTSYQKGILTVNTVDNTSPINVTGKSALYQNVFNLFHSWLNTANDDYPIAKSAMDAEYLPISNTVYYNDGSNVNGLTIQNGVSCTSDGEWIVITTSTSGEKYVYPPVCFTGSDNWEISFKCKTSSYSNQAFGLQMENCGTTTYSGDAQYISWSSSRFNNCMGYGSISYSLTDNDVVTIRRLNGSWILLVNGVQKFSRSYTWSNQRVPGFYTNSGRTQRLKDLRIRIL